MISVTIVGAQTSGNLGAISRVMANFNVSKLFLVSPKCEVITNESKARAMRSIKILENAVILNSLKEVECDYLISTSAKLGTGHNLRRVYLTPEQLKSNIDSNLHYSIVIGREDKGLFNEELEMCDLMVHIPTSKNYKTMNISHALTILLYELFKHDEPLKHVANKKERKAVINRLIHSAKHIENYETFIPIVENLMNRSFIRKKEARALAGLFKKIEK